MWLVGGELLPTTAKIRKPVCCVLITSQHISKEGPLSEALQKINELIGLTPNFQKFLCKFGQLMPILKSR